MHRDRDFEGPRDLPPHAEDLIQDLGLETLFRAMALDDAFLLDVSRKAILSSLNDPDAIRYRQQILRDCLDHPATIREIYAIAVQAIEAEKKGQFGWFFGRSPDSILGRSVKAMEVLVDLLKKLRHIADERGPQFRSEGFLRFFKMIEKELDDEFFREVRQHLKRLQFRSGVLISARLGKGNKGTDYVLRRALETERIWVKRVFAKRAPSYSFEIAERDEAGFRALSELRERGINLVANALAQSVDHILTFFQVLRAELGFYVGCLNLHEQLVRKGEPTCMPCPLPPDSSALSAQGLYDVCLALRREERVVGNDLAADHKTFVIITGANQGGKSTFLRSVGLAYLMMQCGMFVAAERFSASVCNGLFTHFKREEDPTMKSGKFDEELGRMSRIVDSIRPNSVLLCNESFASTNEREGSEIARQVIRALLEVGVKVLFVTHLFDLAQGFWRQQTSAFLFLRAERHADGKRTFKIVEGEPLPTSYGQDLYKEIFGVASRAVPAM